MIQHLVCFKFKEDASAEAVQQHLDMFADLKDKISQIVDYAGGPVIPGEAGEPRRFDTAHNVVFASLADLNIYLPHEAHQQFIAANKAIWEEVLVVDSEIQ
jgi:hypothetical protein